MDCSLLMQADAEDGGVVLVMVCGGRLGQWVPLSVAYTVTAMHSAVMWTG